MLMVALEFTARPAFEVLVSLLLVLFPAINWLAAALLWRASRSAPEVVSLAARVDDQLVLAVASTLGGLLGLNRLAELGLGADSTLALLALALLLASLPGLDWLRVWRSVWMPYVLRGRGPRE
jgi:hypothetical protein